MNRVHCRDFFFIQYNNKHNSYATDLVSTASHDRLFLWSPSPPPRHRNPHPSVEKGKGNLWGAAKPLRVHLEPNVSTQSIPRCPTRVERGDARHRGLARPGLEFEGPVVASNCNAAIGDEHDGDGEARAVAQDIGVVNNADRGDRRGEGRRQGRGATASRGRRGRQKYRVNVAVVVVVGRMLGGSRGQVLHRGRVPLRCRRKARVRGRSRGAERRMECGRRKTVSNVVRMGAVVQLLSMRLGLGHGAVGQGVVHGRWGPLTASWTAHCCEWCNVERRKDCREKKMRNDCHDA